MTQQTWEMISELEDKNIILEQSVLRLESQNAKLVEALEMILLFHHIETAKDYAKSALQQLKENDNAE
jgi:hypothetical protein